MDIIKNLFNSRYKVSKSITLPTSKLVYNKNLNFVFELVGKLNINIPIWKDIDDAVLYSTIGQMLSLKVTSSIIKKLLNKHNDSNSIIKWASTTHHIKGPIDCVSQRKRKTLNEWQTYKQNNDILSWKNLPTSKLRKEITKIWGLGSWAADMIAIFHYGKMDVWPENDIGIQKIAKIIFKTNDKQTIYKHVNGMETIVSLYFWELINQNLVNELIIKINNNIAY